ncbi:MAG: 6,7-dimethyl-8-ribityllumazine synthase [Comamonadaceae bacterium]|nr:MAG: 6,7-dimethyl-8-ribityllumazine synthase [Comamonadaceae bacterium]
MNPYIVQPDLDGAGLHIGIVRARFNEAIGEAELQACLAELGELGVDEESILVATVPGALEIGLTVATMAESGEFDALIALGAVIRGETYHFEIVSNEMASAITRVSLETGVPVANGVLTTETDEQAVERAPEKGRDCARVAVEMANLIAALDPEEDDGEDDDEDEDDEDDEEEDEDFDDKQSDKRR